MKRGAIRKKDSTQLNIWVPKALFPLIDMGVQKEDTDRSKFVRNAIREKLERAGINIDDLGNTEAA
ncbi:MAG TPA: hypothetical protein VEC99_11240 [Clostridia bacterium]|nr:hypothetical protein [Clostridia bacterium]